jgi:hypothetical protein
VCGSGVVVRAQGGAEGRGGEAVVKHCSKISSKSSSKRSSATQVAGEWLGERKVVPNAEEVGGDIMGAFVMALRAHPRYCVTIAFTTA